MPSSKPMGAKSPTPAHDLNCLTIDELEALAHERMDKQTRDYYNEGADAGSTLAANTSAYEQYRIVPRVLRDISHIDTTISDIFGAGSGVSNALPFGVAPTAMQCLAHSEGEVATARACRNAGVAMGLSSFATKTVEEVAEAAGDHPLVLQLYLFEEREHSRKLIERAKKAGFKAVFLTVDTPMLGRRNLEIRNQFTLPGHLSIPNFKEEDGEERGEGEEDDESQEEDSSSASSKPTTKSNTPTKNTANASQPRKGRPSTPGYTHHPPDSSNPKRVPPSGPVTFHSHAANPTLTWASALPWLLQTAAPMKVFVKGVLSPHDALLAAQHRAHGIVVSNHGGRQLDGAISTLDALPPIVAAMRGLPPSRRIPVHIDGGVRHGSHVFKALALGADFVWVGRPALWGLAYKGEEGVRVMLRLLGDEVRLCMGLAGCKRVADINDEYLVRVGPGGVGISKL